MTHSKIDAFFEDMRGYLGAVSPQDAYPGIWQDFVRKPEDDKAASIIAWTAGSPREFRRLLVGYRHAKYESENMETDISPPPTSPETDPFLPLALAGIDREQRPITGKSFRALVMTILNSKKMKDSVKYVALVALASRGGCRGNDISEDGIRKTYGLAADIAARRGWHDLEVLPRLRSGDKIKFQNAVRLSLSNQNGNKARFLQELGGKNGVDLEDLQILADELEHAGFIDQASLVQMRMVGQLIKLFRDENDQDVQSEVNAGIDTMLARSHYLVNLAADKLATEQRFDDLSELYTDWGSKYMFSGHRGLALPEMNLLLKNIDQWINKLHSAAKEQLTGKPAITMAVFYLFGAQVLIRNWVKGDGSELKAKELEIDPRLAVHYYMEAAEFLEAGGEPLEAADVYTDNLALYFGLSSPAVCGFFLVKAIEILERATVRDIGGGRALDAGAGSEFWADSPPDSYELLIKKDFCISTAILMATTLGDKETYDLLLGPGKRTTEMLGKIVSEEISGKITGLLDLGHDPSVDIESWAKAWRLGIPSNFGLRDLTGAESMSPKSLPSMALPTALYNALKKLAVSLTEFRDTAHYRACIEIDEIFEKAFPYKMEDGNIPKAEEISYGIELLVRSSEQMALIDSVDGKATYLHGVIFLNSLHFDSEAVQEGKIKRELPQFDALTHLIARLAETAGSQFFGHQVEYVASAVSMSSEKSRRLLYRIASLAQENPDDFSMKRALLFATENISKRVFDDVENRGHLSLNDVLNAAENVASLFETGDPVMIKRGLARAKEAFQIFEPIRISTLRALPPEDGGAGGGKSGGGNIISMVSRLGAEKFHNPSDGGGAKNILSPAPYLANGALMLNGAATVHMGMNLPIVRMR